MWAPGLPRDSISANKLNQVKNLRPTNPFGVAFGPVKRAPNKALNPLLPLFPKASASTPLARPALGKIKILPVTFAGPPPRKPPAPNLFITGVSRFHMQN